MIGESVIHLVCMQSPDRIRLVQDHISSRIWEITIADRRHDNIKIRIPILDQIWENQVRENR